LKKVYGLSRKEIAAYLGITESTVQKHVAKGLLMCSEYLAKSGYPQSALKQRRADTAE
jgi:RNA polymerase sigma-70 factor (ECF subfamily)